MTECYNIDVVWQVWKHQEQIDYWATQLFWYSMNETICPDLPLIESKAWKYKQIIQNKK